MTSSQTKPHKKYEGDIYQKGLVYEISASKANAEDSNILTHPTLLQNAPPQPVTPLSETTHKDNVTNLPPINKQDPAATDLQRGKSFFSVGNPDKLFSKNKRDEHQFRYLHLIPKILTIHLNSPFQPKYVISVCG
jgi:hypothetical protein